MSNKKTTGVDDTTPKDREAVVSSDIQLILSLATNPNIDAGKLEAIIAMQEKKKVTEAERAFNTAMATVQKIMPTVPCDKNNNQTHSKYASYEQMLKWTKDIYTNEGFSLSFYEEEAPVDNEIRICVDVMHSAGYTKKRHIDIPIDDKGIKGTVNKTRPHAKGSSVSYGRSYLVKMVFNIPTGNGDDGNAASKHISGNIILDIKKEKKRLKLSDIEFEKRLKNKYGVKKIEELFDYQGTNLLKTLKSM